MSRTQRRKSESSVIQSPISKYISFSGSTGKFKYYDKELGDTFFLDSFKMIVLDTRASITGFSEKYGSMITSNLVENKDLGNTILDVCAYSDKKRIRLAKGIYSEIKANIKDIGGKFTTNLYCICDFGQGFTSEICNLQVSGSNIGQWMKLVEATNNYYYDYEITATKTNLLKRQKGVTVEVTKKEQDDLDKLLKENPRHRQPVWFYSMDFIADDSLSKTEAERADNAENVLSDYFSSVSAMQKIYDSEKQTQVIEKPIEEPKDDIWLS